MPAETQNKFIISSFNCRCTSAFAFIHWNLCARWMVAQLRLCSHFRPIKCTSITGIEVNFCGLEVALHYIGWNHVTKPVTPGLPKLTCSACRTLLTYYNRVTPGTSELTHTEHVQLGDFIDIISPSGGHLFSP